MALRALGAPGKDKMKMKTKALFNNSSEHENSLLGSCVGDLPVARRIFSGLHPFSFIFYFIACLCSRPCAFTKSVALSSALALPSPLVRIIS